MGRMAGRVIGASLAGWAAGGGALADSYVAQPGQQIVIPNVIIDAGGVNAVSVSGGGTVVLGNGGNSYSGGTAIFGGSTVSALSDAVLGNVNGGVFFGDQAQSGTLLLNSATDFTSARSFVFNAGGGIVDVEGAGRAAYTGTTSGSGGLTKTGPGTLTLGGAGSYTGPTFIAQGVLQTSVAGALPSTTDLTIANAAVLDLAGNAQTVGSLSGPGLVTLGAGTLSIGGNGSANFSGVISGTGGLTVFTPGYVTLSGNNTYTGATAVTGGTLVMGTVQALPSTSAVSVSAGAVLDLASYDQQIGSLAGGGTVTLGTATLTTGNDNTNTVFSGGLSGSGTLVKAGTGTTVLEGAVGPMATVVTAGILQVGDQSNPAAALGGSVSVTGGTLAGNGTVLGPVTVTGGSVTPGAGAVGTLTVGSYTQTSGGTLAIELSPKVTSVLAVSGSASLAGTLAITADSGIYKAGVYRLLTAASVTGAFSSLSGLVSPGFDLAVTSNNGEVDLTLTQRRTLAETATIYPDLTNVALDDAQGTNSTVLARTDSVRLRALVDGMSIATLDPNHRAGGSALTSPYGAWAQASYTVRSTVDANNGAQGYHTTGGGFLTGFDTRIDNSITAGAAIGYSYMRVKEGGGATGTVSAPHLAAYTSWWEDDIALDGSVSAGYASFKGSRPVAQTASNAQGSFRGIEFGGAVQASTLVEAGWVGLQPAAGIQAADIVQSGFSESGAQLYNLTGKSQNSGSIRPFVSLAAATRVDVGSVGYLQPHVKVAYAYETIGTGRSITVVPQNDAASFVQEGASPSRSTATVDAGLELEMTPAIGAFVDYATNLKLSGTSAQAVNAGLRLHL